MAGLAGPPGEENVDWTGCREQPDGRAWCHRYKYVDDNVDDDFDDDFMIMIVTFGELSVVLLV